MYLNLLDINFNINDSIFVYINIYSLYFSTK